MLNGIQIWRVIGQGHWSHPGGHSPLNSCLLS